MQCQVQQMKSSIANIQHHLRKLESCEQTLKLNEASILPQSIIHEDTHHKPTPTPKITASIPNITRTDVYTPARHHLDDTEMKKILTYNHNHSHHQNDEGRSKKKKTGRSSDNKEKSMTLKTKYIYDGGRVVFIPPLLETQPDFGHIVVQTDRTTPNSKQTKNQRARNVAAQQQYGTSRKQPKTQRNNTQKQKNRIKMSQVTTNPYRYKQQEPYNYQDEIQKYHRVIAVGGKQKVVKKSIKIQCKIGMMKIKEPFVVSWNVDTDSEFSSMDI